MKTIMIIGATSAIAGACARLWAAQDGRFFLVARDRARLDALAADLRVRGAREVHTWQMDAVDTAAHESMMMEGLQKLGRFDIALIAHGTLPDQPACQADVGSTLQALTVNALSVIALLTRLANQFERQRSGALAVISSVAGDRGRASNYVYGSAKACVSVFCDGLRIRLARAAVSLTDVRPGFVDTPMTRTLALPPLLLAQPEQVARRIVAGIARRADVLYAPAWWAPIMWIIRLVPRSLFKRMNL